MIIPQEFLVGESSGVETYAFTGEYFFLISIPTYSVSNLSFGALSATQHYQYHSLEQC